MIELELRLTCRRKEKEQGEEGEEGEEGGSGKE
jgi:hypothetical protein